MVAFQKNKEETFMNVILGALIAGILVGAIPAICGAIKSKIGLGIGGFFACVVCNLILGMLLSIPCCALFLFLIFRKDSAQKDETQPR